MQWPKVQAQYYYLYICDYVVQLQITYRKKKILEKHSLIILKIRQDFEIHSSKKITKQVQFQAMMEQLLELKFHRIIPSTDYHNQGCSTQRTGSSPPPLLPWPANGKNNTGLKIVSKYLSRISAINCNY